MQVGGHTGQGGGMRCPRVSLLMSIATKHWGTTNRGFWESPMVDSAKTAAKPGLRRCLGTMGTAKMSCAASVS